MRTTMQRWAPLGVVMGCLMAMGLVPPANAAGTTQISGSGFYETMGECGTPPAGFADYPGLVVEGDLEGCIYTDVLTAKNLGAPSGIYLETGREMFVGSMSGGLVVGTFETTYKFESKWSPDVLTGAEVKGRCQHPIVAGSGTGGFAGATGRLDFKDEVATGLYYYRGHINLG